MPQSAPRRRGPARPAMASASDPWALVLALCAIALGLAITLLSPPPSADAQDRPAASPGDEAGCRGAIAVTPGPDEDQDVLDGVVFDDRDRDCQHDENESGIAGVEVSNGSETVTTDEQGRYEIAVRDGQTVFVAAPDTWQAPVDDEGAVQLSYPHSPDGAAESEQGDHLPTGPLPDAVDFPLASTEG